MRWKVALGSYRLPRTAAVTHGPENDFGYLQTRSAQARWYMLASELVNVMTDYELSLSLSRLDPLELKNLDDDIETYLLYSIFRATAAMVKIDQ